MDYILKIKYDGVLRRVSVQSRPDAGGPDLTYCKLESKIREIFQLPSSLKFSVTYVDRDKDEVTIGEDEDIEYALVKEGLNPLRLDVAPKTKSNSNQSTEHNESKQKMHVDEDGFEGMDKHIQSQEAHSLNAPHIFSRRKAANTSSDSCDQEKVESDEKTELEAKDVPLQFAPAASFINFSSSYDLNPFNDQTSSLRSISSSSFDTANNWSPFNDQTSFLKSSSLSRFSTTGFADKSKQDEAYVLPDNLKNEALTSIFSLNSANSEGKLDENLAVPVSISKLAPSAEVRMPCSSLIHDGVRCDMCNMFPIVGSRFKSNRKYDYDLCGNCYKNTWKKDEYFQVNSKSETNIVSPLASFKYSSPQAGFQYSRGNTIPSIVPGEISNASMQSTMATTASLGNPTSRIAPNQNLKGKLDSRVVQDVTVPEGTPFPLGTRFIKTWRLKNSGKYAWPSGTKLVRVAGDNLGSFEAVIAELFNVVHPECEIDVSLDLVAPTEPGLYASHWRLMIPTGEKFGHRAWVLIEARAMGDS
ncbi:hypothetical protein O6H91_15G076200 [Diphasiastrum complanatum]|uniref:Uncharacterized protein n=1 Tax=Diphasiastrum complanatum TaxID=34168 RepID=A0ACC2BJT4_DIPCM|nr:hypothetical protein O6H91_15G076200 [Diphasiastrum complanatum]